MEFKEFVQALREIGFPAAVAIFVLYRLDGILRDVRDEIRELRHLLGDRRRNLREEDQ